MRLSPSKPQEGKIYYIAKSYRNDRGISTKKNIRRLGTLAEIRERENVSDAWAWAKAECEKETINEASGKRTVTIKCSADKRISKEEHRLYNLGYMIIDKIYHELGIDHICEGMERKGQFKFSLSEIVRQLVLCRILWPSSKLETWKLATRLALVKPVGLHQIYRALLVVEKHLDYLQERLFHYSKDLLNRNTSIIYYDCTNFFYESTRETELCRPGASKENRRTPIVQMGIFMDADGLPLAFNINPGNTNEQTTLRPLEKLIGEKMNIEEFVMCTDSGLSSGSNKLYNDTDRRKFITAQSVKTLPNTAGKKKSSGKIKEWALANDGWRLANDCETTYTLEQIKKPENRDRYYNKIFYKECWYPTWVKDAETGIETKLEQRCIVSFSLKYFEYQRSTRSRNLDKAEKAIRHGNASDSPKNFRSYIVEDKCTKEGELAEFDAGYHLDKERIEYEELYDGFYAICTNLEEYTDKFGNTHHSLSEILNINRARWEIEESFRIMKTHLKARPTFLQDDREIKAHFALCFVSLFVYRVLEHRLGDKFSTDNIINTLRDLNALYVQSEGFIPTFTRTELTDKMFDISGFYLDTQIIMLKKLKSIISSLK